MAAQSDPIPENISVSTTVAAGASLIRAFGGGDTVPPAFFAAFFPASEVGPGVDVTNPLATDRFGTGNWGGSSNTDADKLHGDSAGKRYSAGATGKSYPLASGPETPADGAALGDRMIWQQGGPSVAQGVAPRQCTVTAIPLHDGKGNLVYE